jgi:hypothetical protein
MANGTTPNPAAAALIARNLRLPILRLKLPS